MSEISIKIKGPISKVRNTKTKKKAKAKPKTKTEAYLEKLKGREYSYNVSEFYDYKAGLQPTYIYRQQTIPQLQQDSKHNELIKYLEHMKKTDRELQTGKFRNTDPPPAQYFPKTTSSMIVEDITKIEKLEEELKKKEEELEQLKQDLEKPKEEEEDEEDEEEHKQEPKEEPKNTELKEYLKKMEEINKIKQQLAYNKRQLNKAIKREIEGLNYEGYESSVYQDRLNKLKTEKEQLELGTNILKNK